jgi:pimeloyl-ACP methyl ester carboxylesterase
LISFQGRDSSIVDPTLDQKEELSFVQALICLGGKVMLRLTLISAASILVALSGSWAFAQTSGKPIVNRDTPTPDCSARVNVDRNGELPGYVADWDGKKVCLPFTPTNQLLPLGVSPDDLYIKDFSDARIREKWAACKADPACAEKTLTAAKGFAKFEPRDTGTVDKKGAIDFDGVVDLSSIRRPAYFGQAPYGEAIASADQRTSIVEFTVPRDSYEQQHLKLTGDIKLRGWYIRGEGVADDNGQKIRGLVIMNNGGGSEFTAIDNPKTAPFTVDKTSGEYSPAKSDELTEEPGIRHWRGFLSDLNMAGFDVLITDRRGNGISGGRNGFNTAEQANDMFRELEQLEAGNGLRVLGPDGKLSEGEEASKALRDGASFRDIPVVVGGYSRGSYATQWFMHKNFVENCNYDLAKPSCAKPVGLSNVKGAILYGPNSAGLGYRLAGHDAVEGALRVDFNTTYYVDSVVPANVDKWPGLQIIKGTWDYVEGLEGSLDTYRRAKGLKDISVFLGPHILQTQNLENMKFAGQRMVAFATAAVLGKKKVAGAINPKDLKELVTSAPHVWELSTAISAEK